MSKLSKPKNSKNRLKGTKKGKVKKVKPEKQNGNGRRKKSDNDDSLDQNDSIEVKKRPSKVELKLVIDHLKKDANLLVVRKALKYVPYYLKSEGLTKKLLSEIIRLWAEASEKVRVICLLCLIRIYTKLKDNEKKQTMIKKLYTTFLDKCRITKHETMSMIGFMRHSLVELYKLNPQIALKQAQVSCQQLAMTLKNATTHKNEETYKSVLNWQFANCLILLSQMITSQSEDSPVKALTNQVIQLNLGAINLLMSPRYYPFYCHLIENLIHLSKSANVFIPILPLILSILNRIEMPMDKKQQTAKKSSVKSSVKKSIERDEEDDDESDDEEDEEDYEDEDEDEDEDSESQEVAQDEKDKEQKRKEYNIDLLNHVSLDEAHCLDYNIAVLDKLYELNLLYLANQCHRIAFPELVFLPSVQMKKWLKRNPGSPTLKFKILFDKMKADCEKLEEARKSVDFAFSNYPAIDAWEKKMRDSKKLCLPKLLEKYNSKEP